MDTSSNNKRIAKNTLLLYMRLLFTMAVGLFTSRVILNTLGIDDYGVYNVVAGVVTMFSLLTGSMSNAISRFLTFNLGKGDINKLSVVFSTSLNIVMGMSLIVLVLTEIIGVWFLNNHLNIPLQRLYAANWVLQFSIFTFVLNLISVPYNAAIIAHERMSVFAYISILEVTLKLVIVYMLYISPFDKLITYAALFAGVAVVIRSVYRIYCSRHFQECHYRFVHDKSILKEMGNFAGWNFFGSSSFLFYTQGVNIATNMFFNVSVNAARGISNQVEGIVKQFVTNFTTAINPQITKSYAAGNYDYTYELVCKGAKYSSFLLMFLCMPFWFEAEQIMKLWLNIYPRYAPLFLRLTLIVTIIDLMGNSLANAIWATGKVKKYYTIVSPVSLLVLPLSCLLFWMGFPAYISYVVTIVIYASIQLIRLTIAKDIMNFPVGKYAREVFLRVFSVLLVAFILPSIPFFLLSASLPRLITVTILSCVSVLIWVYIIGLGNSEKIWLKDEISKRVGSNLKWIRF